MVTTREFITVAAWRLLEDAALKSRYIAADAPTRRAMLAEILRLEPVVGSLYRRATADVTVTLDGASHTIPAGAHVELSIAAANTEEATVGACPLHFRHDRIPTDPRTPGEVLSFGDGAHRCPGAYVALQESDIFLHRLCTLPNVRLARAPDVQWNTLVAGYELRNCIIAID
jgi:cytochrome P450